MEKQRHVVKRQIVEIVLADPQFAWRTQETLAHYFKQQFPRLLDRVLSDFSPSGSLHRFERLELDLGELPEASLIADIEENLESTLRAVLSDLSMKKSVDLSRQTVGSTQTHQAKTTDFMGNTSAGHVNPPRTVLQNGTAAQHTDQIDPFSRVASARLTGTDFTSQTEAGLHQTFTDKTWDRALSKPIEYVHYDETASDEEILPYADRGNLELLIYFLKEGHLPWWVDHAKQGVPEQALSVLLNTPSTDLSDALAGILSQPNAFERAVTYFNDTLLLDLAGKLAGGDEQIVVLADLLLKTIPRLTEISTKPVATIRKSLWHILLQSILFYRFTNLDLESLTTSAILTWSKALELNRTELLIAISQQIQRDGKNRVSEQVNRALEKLREPEVKETLNKLISFMPFDIAQESVRQDHYLRNLLLTVHPELVEGLNQSFLNNLQGLKDSGTGTREDVSTDKETNVNFQVNQTSSNEMFAYTSFNVPAKTENISQKRMSAVQTNSDDTIFSELPTFCTSEVIYIDNAGLCILWPYLKSFFERLALVEHGRFQDRDAQDCAVALLQYLATGSTEAPEYLLSFNKLLCGIAPDAVFKLTEPLSDPQLEACEDLLASVIANASILNNISHDGFRGSFLLRNGILSSEAGNWLLRTERKTYDAVLDRFPWQWQWFKLPWMEHPVRVEW